MAPTSRPRVALIHATPLAMAPVQESFARLWPEAETFNLLDDSLPRDAERGGEQPPFGVRFDRLAAHAIAAGAQAILFTCSAFGPSIEACRSKLTIPVLKPNEAMFEDALSLGTDVGLIATFEPALRPMTDELLAAAVAKGVPVHVKTVFVPGAMSALQRGEVAAHDELVAEGAKALRDQDVICLAQFSMASAWERTVQRSGLRVLTSPDSAVNQLRRRLT